MPRPRTTFALLALLVLAGCSAPGSVSLDRADDVQLADHATRGLPPADTPEIGEPLRAAVENGSGTVTDARRVPFDTSVPVAHGGVVYELNYTVVDERTVPRFDVTVDYNPSELPAETVTFENLSDPDREALSGLLTPGNREYDEGPDVQRTAVYESPSASTLAGTETAVSYRGETYLVEARRDGSATLRDYRYTATRIASVEEYGATLRESHEFVLDDVSTDQQSVLREARNGTYYAEGGDDEAFAGVVERFRAHEGVTENNYAGEWIVRWRGETYWASLRYPDYSGESTAR